MKQCISGAEYFPLSSVIETRISNANLDQNSTLNLRMHHPHHPHHPLPTMYYGREYRKRTKKRWEPTSVIYSIYTDWEHSRIFYYSFFISVQDARRSNQFGAKEK